MTKRISEEIDGLDVFTYDTDLLAEAHTMRKPELLLLAKGRKYAGLYKLNKAELAIIVADTLTAERDETYALRDELLALGFRDLAINDTPRTRSEAALTSPAFDEEAVYAQAEQPRTFSPEFLRQQAENEAAYAKIPPVLCPHGIAADRRCSICIEDAKTAVRPGRPKMDRYSHWAMSHPLIPGGDGNVMQGHVDYCADWGHATYTDNGRVSGVCPRCGDLLTDDVRMAKQAFEDAHRIAAEVIGDQRPRCARRMASLPGSTAPRVCNLALNADGLCPDGNHRASSEPPYAVDDRVRWSGDSRLMFVRQVTPTGAYVAPSRSGTMFAFAAFEDLAPWTEPTLYPNSGLDALVRERDEARTKLAAVLSASAELADYWHAQAEQTGVVPRKPWVALLRIVKDHQ